jgi:hypothetical protein
MLSRDVACRRFRRSPDIARRSRRSGRGGAGGARGRRRDLARRRAEAAEEIAQARLGRLDGLRGAELLFRLRWRGGRRRCWRRSIRRGGGNRGFALGLLAADLAARPGEIIGAAGGCRQRLAFTSVRAASASTAAGREPGPPSQLVGADGRATSGTYRTGQRPWRGLAGTALASGVAGSVGSAIRPEREANRRVTSRST